MLFGMKETQFKSSLSTKQTNNQLFFSSPAVTTGSDCFFFFAFAFHWEMRALSLEFI